MWEVHSWLSEYLAALAQLLGWADHMFSDHVKPRGWLAIKLSHWPRIPFCVHSLILSFCPKMGKIESRELKELYIKLQLYKVENGVFFPDLQTRAEMYFISEELSCHVFHSF